MKRHASMNRVYRLIWSQVLNTWVCCAENAKGHGKSISGRKLIAAALALMGGVFLTPLAMAGPVGGQVSAGAGTISQTGVNTTITQNTANLAINWQDFSIGANESVRFIQPSTMSVALNRVTGQNPSQILGSLSANGQVFVLNPNGVLFGSSAQVNVGGLVASTLNLSDADLMAGNYSFGTPSPASGRGAVVNQGHLTAAPGGYIALLAPEVRNEGVISATLGTALLAAGDKVTLNLNNGSLLSYSIDQGALQALADNKQLIQADGGRVFMSAKAADALSSAVVNNTGIIQARTIQNVGGVIKLMGDMQVGTVNVGGTLDASVLPSPAGVRGAGGAGGGFIETSAAHVKVANDAHITTAAPNGLAGTWLIDPVDFTIAAVGGDITGAALSTNLLTTGVTIYSTQGLVNTLTGLGDVNVNDAVSWSANQLVLNAQRNININANLNGSGTASLALEYGQSPLGTGNYFLNNGAKVNLPAGQNFSTTLGLGGATTVYTVITALGVAADATVAPGTMSLQGMNTALAGNYVLGGDIVASPTSTWNSDGAVVPTYAGFTPISNGATQFTGTFNGLGHTISNLVINRPTTDYVGLFGSVGTGSVISNVGLVGNSVSGSFRVGGLAGWNFGSITGSYATGSVSGLGSFIGGLVGFNSGTVSNSYATGNVSGSSSVGGLVGNNSNIVSNSYATGNVSGSSSVGGLVGNNSNIVSNSYATGSVSGTDSFGGLVGRNNSYGTISNSYAVGSVGGLIGIVNVGGLIGLNYGTVSNSYAMGNVNGNFVGGLVGRNYGTISNSYATGNVSGTRSGGLVGQSFGSVSNSYATGSVSGTLFVGGLLAYNGGTISNSYATGSVSGTSNVGGLVGRNYGTGTVSNSYATGSVSGSTYVGGLVGNNLSTVSNSFWDTATSGQTIGIGGLGALQTGATGLTSTPTTNNMHLQANFTAATPANGNVNPAWDFANTWVMYEGHTAPLLRSFMTSITIGDAIKTYDGQVAGNSAFGVPVSNIFGTLNYTGTAVGAVNVGAYTVANLSGLYSNQQGYIINYANSGTTLTINPASVSITASRVYDGTSNIATNLFTLSGLVGTETLALTGTGTLANKNAGIESVVLGSLALGNGTGLASNYTFTGGTQTANVSQLASVAWTGGASGNWSNAANWAGNAIPDFANVAAVTIPTGSNVIYDAGMTSPTTLATLTSSGSLTMAAGTLNTSGNVVTAGYQQTGGTLNVGNNLIVSTNGVISLGNINVSGNLTINSLGGAITQGTGTALTVAGTSMLTTDNGVTKYGVILNNAGNDFGGMVTAIGKGISLSDLNTLNVTLADIGSTVLTSVGNLTTRGDVLGNLTTQTTGVGSSTEFGRSTISGNLSSSSLGTITQNTAGLSVAGSTTLSSSVVNLANSVSNDFVGAVSATGSAVALLDGIGGLQLGTITLTGNLTTRSRDGAITQATGTSMNVLGTSTLIADNNLAGTNNVKYAITLANAGNDFKGNVSAMGNGITLTDANALSVAVTDIGNTSLTTGGNLTASSNTTGILTTTQTAGYTQFGTSNIGGSLVATSPVSVTRVAGNIITVANSPTTTSNPNVTINGVVGVPIP
ncbi:MAG: GLUG motif-containing protein [Gallionella sp.]|nr:GLUG motif-containing protein [Gallionella sp.]MDD4958976.1 GLUG motif-containing protein [Gallionella sp.]